MITKHSSTQLILLCLAICISIILFISGCSSTQVAPFNEEYTLTIENKEMFEKLKGKPLSDKYSDNEAVKILYDIAQNKLYFIASSRYKFHYDFALNVLQVPYSLDVFNNSSYGPGPHRKYLLATIDHFRAANIYAMEFAGSDLITAEEIKLLFIKVKEAAFFGDEMKLLINTSHLLDLNKNQVLNLTNIYPDVIFKGQTFQPINKGTTYGYLKKIYDIKNAIDSIGDHDIMVINENPLDLPLCTGVITTQFQTPLSHINILTHNRGTICMVLTSAWNDDHIDSLENKLVMIKVEDDKYLIEEAKLEDALKFWKNNTSIKEIKLTSDLTIQHIIDIKNINIHSENIVGTKAANFGELNKLQEKGLFKTPEGAFAIPFYFYNQHIKQGGIDSLIQILLNDTTLLDNNTLLDKHLKKIRKAIKNAPLDKRLIDEVEKKINENNFGISYRFRSSTNAEDLKGFNGAGLYDSKTGILGDTVKSIEKAIKDVWASTFTYRGYAERNL